MRYLGLALEQLDYVLLQHVVGCTVDANGKLYVRMLSHLT